jgi:hypothetical protein
MPNALVVMKTYLVLRSQMSKVIRATIAFEYLVDEDELMSEMSDEEQIEYVRETTLEDIVEMSVRYSDQLADAIEIQVKDV